MLKNCVLALAIIGSLAAPCMAGDGLVQAFLNPPDSAKPWTYWWWLNGYATKDGIIRDLDAMKQLGVSGALVFHAGEGPTPKQTEFMSPAWRELFRFAVEEAAKRRIEIGLNVCAGWNAGGPWVEPDDAAKMIVHWTTRLSGPTAFDDVLGKPAAADMTYHDIAVLAWPTTEPPIEAKLTASSSFPKYGVELATDGTAATRWISNSNKPGQGPRPDRPEYLQWDFDETFPAAAVHIVPFHQCGPRDCEMQVSHDGETYQTMRRFQVQQGEPQTFPFDETPARRFRLVVTSSHPHQGEENWNVQISEVMLLQKGQEPTGPRCPGGAMVDLTDKMNASGRLRWAVPNGHWIVIRFGWRVHPRAHTKCVGGGESYLEIDPLSAEAMDRHFAATVGAVIEDVAPYTGKTFNYLHIDSGEIGEPDWTPDFRDEFRHRRGYDPFPYLAAKAGVTIENADVTRRFLEDYDRTLSDLMVEAHHQRLGDLGRRHGLKTHSEAAGYQKPAVDALRAMGANDICMSEFWSRRSETGDNYIHQLAARQLLYHDGVKNAASAAHAYGRPIVQAEAYTVTGHLNWSQDPFALKDIGDRAFCAGLNRNMLCFWVLQPEEESKPGYAWPNVGANFDRHQTWWPMGRAWLTYLARCQYLLQAGSSHADVCYFQGQYAPGYVPARWAMDPPLPSGVDCDTINVEILTTRATAAAHGRLLLAGDEAGPSYDYLVLCQGGRWRRPPQAIFGRPSKAPLPETSPVGSGDPLALSSDVLRKLGELVHGGVTLIGPRPERSIGLANYPHCDTEVSELADALWGTESTPAGQRKVGAGRVIWGHSIDDVMRADGLSPDLEIREDAATAALTEEMLSGIPSPGGFDWIHRRIDRADVYFIANLRNAPAGGDFLFRVAGRRPELWDAVTGEIRAAAAFTQTGDGRTTVPLNLPPRGSIFVVFRQTIPTSQNGPATANWPALAPAMEFQGPWTVQFDPEWGGPESVVFQELEDWTKRSEPGIKHYSGTATYQKTFDLPETVRQGKQRVYLNLGEVKNLAEVRLNGKELGVVWTAPWRVEITTALQSTGNRLEIDVVNLWPNRVIGDAALPPEKRLTKTNVTMFTPDTPLMPSGLLGPVSVVTSTVSPAPLKYRDGRPAAPLRMDARDHGIVLRHGDGPGQCDMLGARDVWVFEDSGTFYMHYDAAGPKGWLSSLAVSKDLLKWEKKGPILDFGKPGEDDSAGACYGVTYEDGNQWHMFYLGTPNASAAPHLVPSFPYLIMKAKASDPAGPWIKQKDVVPFRTKPNTYYSLTASPGQVIKNGDEYLQFFSSTTRKFENPCVQRTLGIARTKDLDGAWTVDPSPMVPIEEQIENSSLYFEQSNNTWFLFTNHIGIDKGEYTDAIWVYWSKDLNKWDPKDKAVVLDGQNCTWSKKCIGLPSVVKVGKRLAVFYDAPGGNSTSHMKRNIGLAWLNLPLSVPNGNTKNKAETDVSGADSIKTADLRCEYLVNPLGIDVTRPRLSWRLESGQRGQKQSAYRILVASSRDKLDKDVGDLWDTGKLQSDQSIHVAYDGKELDSRMQCFWKVVVWDKDGKPSMPSEPAEWSMGLLKPEDWTAKWITNPAPKRLSHPWLRRTFDLKDNIERAVIHVNTPSYYVLRINGKKVSPYVLTPGISKIDKRFLINSYDVSSYLVKGSNCIALWMGPGWHQPRIGNTYNAPILRAQLDIQTPSGQSVIGTDSSWRVKESCISQIGDWEWNLFGGEHYDAREFVPDWDQAGLEDSNWLVAREIAAPNVVHSWQGCESTRLSRPVSPKKIFQLENGKWVLDFGRPLTGWMRLRMHGLKEGQEVKIIYADLNDNDNVRKLAFEANSDGFQSFNQEDVFVSAGKGKETFCSRFNYHSFRYAVISGLSQKPAFEDAVAMMIEPELESAGSFECSNALFNQIHEITRYTLRTQNPGLALGTGEAREKSAYGDGGAHLSGYLYNFRCDANLRKWIRDWSDNQREDGWFGHTAPAFEDHGGGPAWGGQVTELVRRMHLYYDDKDIVEQMYSQLAMYVDFIESKTHDNILRSYTPTERSESMMFIGDWARPTDVPGRTFNLDSTPQRELFNNCYRAMLWQQLQDYAECLGRADEYERCKEHLATIRPLIHKTSYLPEKGTYTFNNQSYLSMALYAHIPPTELRPKILAQLEHEIVVNKKGHLDTGLLGTFIMLDLLIKEDRNDLIALIMGQTTYPGWGFLVKEMGLNTWPETWSAWGSHVILVTATPGAWFFEGLGGILPDPKRPGFKHFMLRPGIVESVDWVKCSYQSPYGEIVSNWKRRDKTLTMDLTIPANTTATIYVPGNEVTESGKSADKAEGVTFLRSENGYSLFKVESGRYSFAGKNTQNL